VGAGAAAAAAAGGAAAAAVSRCSSRGDLAVGFTEDELQGRLRQLKYVITEKLLAVVASSTLENGEQGGCLLGSFSYLCCAHTKLGGTRVQERYNARQK
jgi:hypothetical protein